MGVAELSASLTGMLRSLVPAITGILSYYFLKRSFTI